MIKKNQTISPEDKPARKNILALSKTDKFEELKYEWVVIIGKGDTYDPEEYQDTFKGMDQNGNYIRQCVCGCLGTSRSGLKYGILVQNIHNKVYVWLGRNCQYLVVQMGLIKITKHKHDYEHDKVYYETLLKNKFYTNQFGDRFDINGYMIDKSKPKNLLKTTITKKTIRNSYKHYIKKKHHTCNQCKKQIDIKYAECYLCMPCYQCGYKKNECCCLKKCNGCNKSIKGTYLYCYSCNKTK